MLHSGPDERQVTAAKELAEDLLTVVREEYAKAVANMQQMNMGGGYGGGYQGYAGQSQQQAGYPGAYGGYSQDPNAAAGQQQQPPLPGGSTDPAAAAGAAATPGSTAAPVLKDGLPDKTDTSGLYEAYKGYWAQMGYDVEDAACKS